MKKFILLILKSIWVIIGLIVIYIIFGFLIPYIEVPAKVVQEPKNITAYILTNGVHTDLVVPIKSAEIDWSKEIPIENTISKSTNFHMEVKYCEIKGRY